MGLSVSNLLPPSEGEGGDGGDNRLVSTPTRTLPLEWEGNCSRAVVA